MSLQIHFTGFEQALLWKGAPFQPQIYMGEGELPEGFQVAKITLEASATSLLQWEEALEKARRLQERGVALLWELRLFPLPPFEEEVHALALHLNCEHFTQTVWPTFAEHTFGVLLYQGALGGDFELLQGLAAAFPTDAPLFLALETEGCPSAAHFFQQVNPTRLSPFHLLLRGSYPTRFPFAFPFLAWERGASPLGCGAEGSLLPSRPLPEALLISDEMDLEEVNRYIEAFQERPFRVIHEKVFTQEWEGVDTLVVPPSTRSGRLERKLAGFIAAGGEVVN